MINESKPAPRKARYTVANKYSLNHSFCWMSVRDIQQSLRLPLVGLEQSLLLSCRAVFVFVLLAYFREGVANLTSHNRLFFFLISPEAMLAAQKGIITSSFRHWLN